MSAYNAIIASDKVCENQLILCYSVYHRRLVQALSD